MKEEPTTLQRTAVRWAIASLVLFAIGVLVLRWMYLDQKRNLLGFHLGQQSELAWRASGACEQALLGLARSLGSGGARWRAVVGPDW